MVTLSPNNFYHIYNHANGNENLFRSDDNYSFFLKKYAFHISPIADTFAYCLLPNHFHILVQIKDKETLRKTFPKFETLEKLEKGISKQFSNFFSSYTQSYNKIYSRKGSLFIKNFNRKPIDNPTYFTNTIHYIHNNPQHHGFGISSADWPWSSYQSLISDKKTLLKREGTLTLFGSKQQFIQKHQEPIDPSFFNEFSY